MSPVRLLLPAICFSFNSFSQVPDPVITIPEQELENITENNEDLETEDDSYLQQMMQFLRNPVNLNNAGAAELGRLRILSPLQVHYLISYRNLVGNLIDIYELQALPGWDLNTIRKIQPYVSVSNRVAVAGALDSRLHNGDHQLLVRGSQVLERAKGYRLDSSTATNFYPGSPQKIMVRYTYHYKNILQYGMVAEKDAGEQFFKGEQKQGFDYYGAHIFVRKIGFVKALALGDFTVNLGQGLTQWQSLAFKKSANVINIKREADVLRPYNSAGEIYFHRGLGITLAKKNWEFTLFGSYKHIDANLVADTSQNNEDVVSSLQTSGYHRTKSEAADKGIQRQLAFGGNFSYRYKNLHLGVNGIQYKFKLPLVKSNEPYNKYALSGSDFGNYSFDYSYTFKNFHFFGEAAISSGTGSAFVNGLIFSASARVDLSLLYRNISKSYQSLYASAFTESTFPTNEKGFYAGLSVRPNDFWRIDAFADFYQFPWLRFRVDAPSTGSDYLVQVNYRPSKQFEIYTRFQTGSKAINVNPAPLALSPIMQQPKKNWRTQISYKISRRFTIRNRAELLWFNKNGQNEEQGFLIYGDIIYKSLFGPLSGNLRLQYFESDGYNSRLYAYENDVLYNFSIPVFYNKGVRYYININYEINKKLAVWIKWAQSLFRDKSLIGSGLDEIQGSRRSEIKLQFLYKF